MNRLFGLLIISLSLLTVSIVFDVSWPIFIVLILGILLLFPNSKNHSNEEEFVSDEEIEVELLNSNKKNE
ncbi:hypothetical protein [Lederbergia citri]|uniref:Uncharacterized protein n=1 Tax=Lederbergia citri TaxID=2833580 RepID=A0A942YER2_9BACI|nr:hypothetical protein [Lederbergia citri]MBS4194178.1 hypothetical protein [Lederbergia citri]